MRKVWILAMLVTMGSVNGLAAPQEAPRVEVAGDWQVQVTPGVVKVGRAQARIPAPVTLKVAPAVVVRARDEKHDSLPLFDEKAAPWAKGAKLKQLATSETSAAGMLVPGTLVVKSGPGDAPKYVEGRDYALEAQWNTFGRLPGGSIPEGAPVWLDYDAGWGRLDSVVINRQGTVSLRSGEPHVATPFPPMTGPDEAVLANVWVPGRLPGLTSDNLYPILEAAYPEPKRSGPPPAAKLLPMTWAKLRAGQPVHVLAWGDSVTAGGEASDEAHRWQNRFVALLRERFPKADIRLTTAGWGGRNSDSFLNEPPESEYNFERAVLRPRPDLIAMEFVNDAWMTPEVVEEKYSRLQERFREIGAEWVILTPHFVRPDWMGEKTDRVEKDPRPYVAGVRQFTAKHGVALADASLRWGHLVKEGLPYMTLLSNSINHPDDRGHELFARALMELFR